MKTASTSLRIALLTIVMIAASGCGSDETTPDATDDTAADVSGDTANPDVPVDVQNDDTRDTTGDDVTGDVPGDTAGDTTGDIPTDTPAEVFQCGQYDEWPSIDNGATKFGLTMFHWNIQYVPGGLIGEFNGETISICADMGLTHADCGNFDDEVLTDWIIRVSFQPVLDLYLAHPTWRATFEMPGLMIQAITEKHPDILAKLQCAANNGQIELVSIHWSDQLFLAFPSRDLQWSIDYNRKVFQNAALPLSGVVFNQEGQSGVGKHRIMAENGYTIDVMHRNLFKYHQQAESDAGVWPVYESTGPGAPGPVKVVVGGGVDPTAGVDVAWTFFDDGEVLATPGNPYLAMVTPTWDEREMRKFEENLQEVADAGYMHTTITDYVNRLEKLGIAPKPLPAIADSTWQPPSTEGISRWMGRMGTLGYSIKEDDNTIRRDNYEASTCLAAAKLAVDLAEGEGANVAAERDMLEEGYLDLIKAEVSDATGINPWFGEWAYGYQNNDLAIQKCLEITDSVLPKMGRTSITLDLDAGVAKQDGEFQPIFQFMPTQDADKPVQIVTSATGRTVDLGWLDDGNVYQVTMNIGASDDPTGEIREKRTVVMELPIDLDSLIYTPGLIEDQVVEIPFSSFDLAADQVYVPLTNGLIGIGPDLWLVKYTRSVHLAARVIWDGSNATLQFIDETVPPAAQAPRIFYIVKGTAENALGFARLINTNPNYILTASWID